MSFKLKLASVYNWKNSFSGNVISAVKSLVQKQTLMLFITIWLLKFVMVFFLIIMILLFMGSITTVLMHENTIFLILEQAKELIP